ncbi:MAG: restriction endonuclease subunit S [Bacteroidetes bacterium]|nr:restriction endonuclease subunit S [Bacteroidota bacterium]
MKKLLGELIDSRDLELQTGPFGTQLPASAYVEEGTPVINVRNIGYAELVEEKLEFVPEEVTRRLSQHIIRANDIVFGRKGAVDRHLYVNLEADGWMQGGDCIRLRSLTDKVNMRYLSYSFLSEYHRKWMLNQGGNKATMAALNHDVIRRIQVELPKRDVQDEIASILSSYDELIENNRKRIKLLERAARLLYTEWFVRGRFPRWEGVKKKDGVPEGWEKKTIDDVAETIGGGTPKTEVREYWEDGEITWFSPRDLTANGDLVILDSENKITERGFASCSAKLLPPEAILMTSRATIGVIAICEKPSTTNQGFISLVPREENTRMYILFNLLSRKDELMSNAQGSTFAEINKSTFRGLTIRMPSRDVLAKFELLVYDMIKQVRILKKQNAALTRARDLLLPRLMGGRVKV